MFKIVKGAVLPEITGKIVGLGDLSAATIAFEYHRAGGSAITSRAAVVTDGVKGEVKYAWVEADTLAGGEFLGRWKVTTNSKIAFAPSEIGFVFEVIDPARALVNPYATVRDVQIELKNETDAVVPAIIDAINAASRYVDQHTRKTFYLQDHSASPKELDQFDAEVVGDSIFLGAPILTLTQVQYGTTVLTPGTDYVAKNATGEIHRIGSNWTPSRPDALVKLTGTFGYAQPLGSWQVPLLIPDHIRRATVLIAAAFSGYDRKEVVALDGSRTEIASNTIPKTALDILASRRKPLI